MGRCHRHLVRTVGVAARRFRGHLPGHHPGVRLCPEPCDDPRRRHGDVDESGCRSAQCSVRREAQHADPVSGSERIAHFHDRGDFPVRLRGPRRLDAGHGRRTSGEHASTNRAANGTADRASDCRANGASDGATDSATSDAIADTRAHRAADNGADRGTDRRTDRSGSNSSRVGNRDRCANFRGGRDANRFGGPERRRGTAHARASGERWWACPTLGRCRGPRGDRPRRDRLFPRASPVTPLSRGRAGGSARPATIGR